MAIYTDPTLSVASIAAAMNMHEKQLRRKMKSVIDVTPAEYLRTLRLKKAAELLKDGADAGTAGYSVGFSSHPHFSSCFKAYFGITPSMYALD